MEGKKRIALLTAVALLATGFAAAPAQAADANDGNHPYEATTPVYRFTCPPDWVLSDILQTDILIDGQPLNPRNSLEGGNETFVYDRSKNVGFVDYDHLPDGAMVVYPNSKTIRFIYRDTAGQHGRVSLDIETMVPFQTVRFDSAGGSRVDEQRVQQSRPVKQLQVPTRDGYYFNGWYVGDTRYTNQPITGDTVLTAHWVSNKTHTVTFSDGKPFGSTKTVTVHEGQAVAKPADPTRVGYLFDGWYSGGTRYNFATPVTSDLALTAHWTASSHVVVFDSNGGRPVAPQVVRTGARAKAPKNPTRRGYRFAGWYTARRGGTLWAFGNPVRSNLALYAHWVRN